MTHPNKIIIAEKPTIMGEALCLLMSSIEDVEIVGKAKDGEEVIKLTEQLMPDLVVMDLDLPKVSGLDALQEIKRRCPGVRILVLTTYRDEGHITPSLEAGCNGYLLKDGRVDELVTAIKTVLEGEIYVDSTVLKPVVEGYLHKNRSRQSLTKRERQILGLIVDGHQNSQIAKELGISLKTAEKHRINLMKKLNVHRLADLITLAVSKGILNLPEHKTLPSA